MAEIRRSGTKEAREKCLAGTRLVCAYDSDEIFEKYHLEGAISLSQLKNLVPQLSKDEEIIFYCA